MKAQFFYMPWAGTTKTMALRTPAIITVKDKNNLTHGTYYKTSLVQNQINKAPKPGALFTFVQNVHCTVAFYPPPVPPAQPCLMRFAPPAPGYYDLCVLACLTHQLPW